MTAPPAVASADPSPPALVPTLGTPPGATALLRRALGAPADAAPGPAPRTLLLVAHPDDESVGATALLARLGLTGGVAYATDGAPRDLGDARAAGCASRGAYAALRRRERAAALALAGVDAGRVHDLGHADQEAWRGLVRLTEQVARLAADAELLVTHPYEGGHPDHDACALAARFACGLLTRDDARAPVLAECTSYHADPGAPNGLRAGAFRPHPAAGPAVVLALDAAARARKAAMYACHRSQAAVLAALPPGPDERLRLAPAYDFTRPPPGGPVWYERYGWGVDAAAVCRAAAAARTALGLTEAADA